MENQNSTLTVPFSKLKAVVDQLEKHPVLEDRTEDLTITFEFIIGSLFPTAMQSIHNALQDEHTIGYIEGSHGNNMPLLYVIIRKTFVWVKGYSRLYRLFESARRR